MTSEELKRFALLKIRLQRENVGRSDRERLTREQIEEKARRAVRSGRVNDAGYIV